jgi:photosystem II stability/assembly factor-like uncharacterized protein
MSTKSVTELLEAANPVTEAPSRSVDAAWAAFESSLSTSKRSRRKSVTYAGVRSITWTPRKWILVAAVIVLIAGLAVSVAVRGPSGDARSTNAVGPSSGATFRLVSDAGPSVQPFVGTQSSPQGYNQMTCPTTQVCYMVSSVALRDAAGHLISQVTDLYSSGDGGSTWHSLTAPAGMTLDTPISCFSANDCMVGAQQFDRSNESNGINGSSAPQVLLSTTNGGSSWTTQPVPMPPVLGVDAALDPTIAELQGSLYGLQCFNSESCIAFGTVPTDQPEQPVGASGGSTISRTVAMRTVDGGSTWSSYVFAWTTTPTGGPGWSNVQNATFSCPTQNTCLGLATVLGRPDPSGSGNQPSSLLEFRSSDGGVTWSSNWVSNVQGDQNDLTCPDANDCYATVQVGAAGTQLTPEVLATADGGTTWELQQLFSSTMAGWDGLQSITCPSSNACWAAGIQRSTTDPTKTAGAIFVTQDGGQNWTAAQLPTGELDVTQVDCATTQSCLAIAEPAFSSGTAAQPGPIPSDVLTNRPLASSDSTAATL